MYNIHAKSDPDGLMDEVLCQKHFDDRIRRNPGMLNHVVVTHTRGHCETCLTRGVCNAAEETAERLA